MHGSWCSGSSVYWKVYWNKCWNAYGNEHRNEGEAEENDIRGAASS